MSRVSKIERRGGRDALLGGLLNEGPQQEPAPSAPTPAEEDDSAPSVSVVVSAPSQASVPAASPPTAPTPAAFAAASEQSAPAAASAPSPALAASAPSAPAATFVPGSPDDPRLRPVPMTSQPKRSHKVQLANRIPVELKERLERHRQRTGETINSMLERMLEVGLDIAEAQAGVDKDGNPIER